MDASLFQWFTAARLQSIPISGEILKEKAEELSRVLPLTNTESWTCSSGWLSRWKTRHNMKFSVVKMQLLIKRSVKTGKRENSNLSCKSMTQEISSMLMSCIGASYLIKLTLLLGKYVHVQGERRVRSV